MHKMISHRRAAIALVVAASLPSTVLATPWTFVSTPDFLNADVMDMTGLGTNPNPALYNSINASWESAMSQYLTQIASENPDFVMVAGDLSMQRWTLDAYNEGVFGPKVGTPAYPVLDQATEIARVELASDTMYSQYNARFASHGLNTVYAAVGDHELGDDEMWVDNNPDRVPDEANFLPISRGNIPTLRDKFNEYFVQPNVTAGKIYSQPASGQHSGSAYAVKHNNVMMITVDVFKQNNTDGDVDATIDGEQLNWLNQTLADAENDPTIDHVIVQGHTPVLGNGTLPARNSSKLYLDDGENSAFWNALSAGKADLYFAGEVHDVSVRQQDTDPLLQVVHGAAWGFTGIPTINYLVGTVDGDTLTLEIKSTTLTASGNPLYQASNVTGVRESVVLGSTWSTLGTVTIDNSGAVPGYSNQTGVFSSIQNPPQPEPPAVPLDPAGVSGMQLWLKDASINFNPGAGSFDAQWVDSSGQANHLVSYAGRPTTGSNAASNNDPADTDPTANDLLVALSSGGAIRHSTVSFADAANELMKSDLIGAENDDTPDTEAAFDSLTIFAVYQYAGTGDDSLVRPYGIGSYRDEGDNQVSAGSSSDNFNPANDSTIRKDNGFIGSSSSVLPANELFIRTSRMDAIGDVDQWLMRDDGVGLLPYQSGGSSFTTRDDDFFLGDLRVDETFQSGDDFDVAEVLVFNRALTDEEVAGINAWLFNWYFPFAGDANRDQTVNIGDLTLLAGSFGTSGKTWQQGDFNGDGLVNIGDLTILAGNFGNSVTSPSATTVPESASAILLAGLLAGLLRRSDR